MLPPESALADAVRGAARQPGRRWRACWRCRRGSRGAAHHADGRRHVRPAVAHAPEASVAAYSAERPGPAGARDGGAGGVAVWAGLRACRARACSISAAASAGSPRRSAPHVGHVLGVDVSAGMIAEARARHGDVRNWRFAGSDGGAPALPPGSLDLVLAVDSLPYLVQAGVADDDDRAAGGRCSGPAARWRCSTSPTRARRPRSRARRALACPVWTWRLERGWRAAVHPVGRHRLRAAAASGSDAAAASGACASPRRLPSNSTQSPARADSSDPQNTASLIPSCSAVPWKARSPMNRLMVKPMPHSSAARKDRHPHLRRQLAAARGACRAGSRRTRRPACPRTARAARLAAPADQQRDGQRVQVQPGIGQAEHRQDGVGHPTGQAMLQPGSGGAAASAAGCAGTTNARATPARVACTPLSNTSSQSAAPPSR